MFVPILALLVAMVSIQSGASLAKQLFPLLGVQGTTTLRIVFAALILSAIWRPWRIQLTVNQIRQLLFYGVASIGTSRTAGKKDVVLEIL